VHVRVRGTVMRVRGHNLTFATAFRSLPWSSNSLAVSSALLRAARWRAVQPSCAQLGIMPAAPLATHFPATPLLTATVPLQAAMGPEKEWNSTRTHTYTHTHIRARAC